MRSAVFQDRAQDTLARGLLPRVTPARAATTDTGVKYGARHGHRHQIIALAAEFHGPRLDVLYTLMSGRTSLFAEPAKCELKHVARHVHWQQDHRLAVDFHRSQVHRLSALRLSGDHLGVRGDRSEHRANGCQG
jgi:hypothetical protein